MMFGEWNEKIIKVKIFRSHLSIIVQIIITHHDHFQFFFVSLDERIVCNVQNVKQKMSYIDQNSLIFTALMIMMMMMMK